MSGELHGGYLGLGVTGVMVGHGFGAKEGTEAVEVHNLVGMTIYTKPDGETEESYDFVLLPENAVYLAEQLLINAHAAAGGTP